MLLYLLLFENGYIILLDPVQVKHGNTIFHRPNFHANKFEDYLLKTFHHITKMSKGLLFSNLKTELNVT